VLGSADSGLLDEDLTALLVAVGEAAQDRSRGLMLAIDEVQYLSAEELGALISAIHRTVQLNLPVILVGAGLPQLPGLAGNAKSYAERLFDFPEIGSLERGYARAALDVPVRAQEVEFAGIALDALLSYTRGYPYFLQEWGYHVWRSRSSRRMRLHEATGSGEPHSRFSDNLPGRLTRMCKLLCSDARRHERAPSAARERNFRDIIRFASP
jgi:hypothetical protein